MLACRDGKILIGINHLDLVASANSGLNDGICLDKAGHGDIKDQTVFGNTRTLFTSKYVLGSRCLCTTVDTHMPLRHIGQPLLKHTKGFLLGHVDGGEEVLGGVVLVLLGVVLDARRRDDILVLSGIFSVELWGVDALREL